MMLEGCLPVVQIGSVIGTFMLMLTIGLNTDLKDFPFFKGRVWLFFKSVTGVLFLVPLVVMALIFLVGPESPVAIAMAILAASPVAPMSFIKIPKAGGRHEYITSLNIWLALLAIVTAPLILGLFEAVFDFPVRVSPSHIAGQISLTVLLPVLLGIFLRLTIPNIAIKSIRPLYILANAIILIVSIVLFIATLDDLFLMSLSSYLSMILMIISSLLIGHVLAGNVEEDKTTLALECSFRNPGLALMIASLNFPGRNALPVLIPYILLFLAISGIYIRWRKRYVKAGNVNERPA